MRTIAAAGAGFRIVFGDVDCCATRRGPADARYCRRSSGSTQGLALEMLNHSPSQGDRRRPQARRGRRRAAEADQPLDVASAASHFSGGMKQRFGLPALIATRGSSSSTSRPRASTCERLRFNNMLSEIGENVVVILSTHIVEDISTCAAAWRSSAGPGALTGDPLRRSTACAQGLEKADRARPLGDYERDCRHLDAAGAGRTVITSSRRPADPSFESAPDLETYFSALDAPAEAADRDDRPHLHVRGPLPARSRCSGSSPPPSFS